VPVGFSEALILESLMRAARQFLFIVPAGLDVQEVGLVAVGHVLGIGSDVAPRNSVNVGPFRFNLRACYGFEGGQAPQRSQSG
jgi:hypothetical protein